MITIFRYYVNMKIIEYIVNGSMGNKYTIELNDDGSKTCSCLGYKYRQYCKHINKNVNIIQATPIDQKNSKIVIGTTGNKYKINTITTSQNKVIKTCTCVGFFYRKNCRHIK
jgi:hypothetical protein